MIILVASLLTAFAMEPDAYGLNRDGRILLDQHRYAAAARVFRKAVDRAEAELGPRDPATAMILRNLALAYVHTGDAVQAEQTAKLAYAMMESRFGSDEPGLTPILNVLAECYASTGRVAEARRISEQAVAIGRLAGVHYGIALHNLGTLYEFLGDIERAASFYQRAIEVKAATLGAENSHVALSKVALRRVRRGKSVAMVPLKLEYSRLPAP